MSKTYGIISDMHSIDFKAFPFALNVLKNEGIDSLVLNGNLSGERSGFDSVGYLVNVFKFSQQTGIDVYAVPGSHDSEKVLSKVFQSFEKYDNIINTLKRPKIELLDHHLVFLPGAEQSRVLNAKDGYVIDSNSATGLYSFDRDGYKSRVSVRNINDLKDLVTEPEKTIVFSNFPRKFSNIETAVDVNGYGVFNESYDRITVQYKDESQDALFLPQGSSDLILNKKIYALAINKIIGKENIPKGAIIPSYYEAKKFKNSNPDLAFELKKENMGSEDLKSVYEKIGIIKNVSGHFLDSVGRAHTSEEKPVEENVFVDNLFYNASSLDALKIGTISVDGPKIAYENINLRKYMQL